MSVARTSQGFCPCGLQIEPGDHFTTCGGIAVHVGCEDRNQRPAGESAFYLTATPASQPKTSNRFAPVSLDGPTRNDTPRLVGQLQRTYDLTSSGRWWGLTELAQRLGCLETSAGARLRDLRKREHGGHMVLCRLRADGSGEREYRLVITSKTNGAVDAA